MQITLFSHPDDKIKTLRIHNFIQGHGINVTLRDGDILSQNVLLEDAHNEIYGSGTSCFLISNSSVTSAWFLDCLKTAIRLGKKGTCPLIPCLLDDVIFPTTLENVKCVDFIIDFSSGMDELLNLYKQVIEKRRLQEFINKILLEMSPAEIDQFLSLDPDMNYICADTRTGNVNPNPFYFHLVHRGLMYKSSTCGNDIWFSLTEDGSAFRDYLLEKRKCKLR